MISGKMNNKLTLNPIAVIFIVIFMLGCKKNEEVSHKYYIKFTINGERYEYKYRLGSGIDKHIDDEGNVSWHYTIDGSDDMYYGISLSGAILDNVVENKKYINYSELYKREDDGDGIYTEYYKGDWISIAYGHSYHSDPFIQRAQEITFTKLADDYIQGRFSGTVINQDQITEEVDSGSKNSIAITEGEFYVPITAGQWPYK